MPPTPSSRRSSTPIANRNLINDSIRFVHTQNIFDFPAGYWTAANVPRGQLPGFVPAGLKAQGFTDFSAFDWKNRMIDESSRQDESFHAFNVRLEQSFWQNHAGLELAYDEQRIDRRSRNSFFSINNANHIFLDTSVTLPNGQANPNLGRPYAVYGLSNWRDRFERRRAAHATGFLRYDFKDLKPSWTRWLGRHSLTGLYEESRVDLLDQRPMTSTLGEALDATTTGDLGINTRRPGILVYMGPSIIGNSNPLRLQPIQVPAIQAGPMIPRELLPPRGQCHRSGRLHVGAVHAHRSRRPRHGRARGHQIAGLRAPEQLAARSPRHHAELAARRGLLRQSQHGLHDQSRESARSRPHAFRLRRLRALRPGTAAVRGQGNQELRRRAALAAKVAASCRRGPTSASSSTARKTSRRSAAGSARSA